jgi:deazaflavin-dependent oxidoreductase (nitroreductase family)
MPNPTSHPWWKRPTVRWVAAVVALRLTAILLFRSRRPEFLDAVRRFNKRALNPLMLRLAGRRHWYAARLEHVGRRTGRSYATPVVARPVHNGFAIPLPYGPYVDWRRNLQATGSGVLQVDGVRHTIRDPRIVAVDDLPELTAWWRALSRAYAIRQWLVVTTPAEPPAPVRSASAPPVPAAP